MLFLFVLQIHDLREEIDVVKSNNSKKSMIYYY